MRCQHCNELLPLSARSCFSCGAPVERERQSGGFSRERAGIGASTWAPPEPQPGRVAQLSALRDRPYSSAREILTLHPDQQVTVLGERWGFVHVETPDGRRGFVRPDDVVVDGAPPATNGVIEEKAASQPMPWFDRDAMAARLTSRDDTGPLARAPLPSADPADEPTLAAPAADIAPPTPWAATPRVEEYRAPVEAITAPPLVPQPPAPLGPAPAPAPSSVPAEVPLLEEEFVRYRATFLDTADGNQSLLVTNQRLIITGGPLGDEPGVFDLDTVAAVRLVPADPAGGEESLAITISGVPGVLPVTNISVAYHVRNQILAVCTDLHRRR